MDCFVMFFYMFVDFFDVMFMYGDFDMCFVFVVVVI